MSEAEIVFMDIEIIGFWEDGIYSESWNGFCVVTYIDPGHYWAGKPFESI